MTRPRWRISAELLPVTLVLACLAGSTVLVIRTHTRFAADRKAKEVRRSENRSVAPPVPVPTALPPAPPAPPAPPSQDPTPELLDRLAAQTEALRHEAEAADRRTAGLERARRAALADAKRFRQRETLVRAQADSLEAKAQQLETEIETTALERDVLARQRDDLRDKIARARARAGSSFAVLPYKGPNGTWQRPIAIECHDGTVTLQPGGPTFTLVDLDEGLSPRSNAFIAAIAHEMLKVQGTLAPDGGIAVPYILFLIRPDGIRPYYEARARLEPLGINFGYELVDQGLEIDYPDLNDPSEWEDGVSPKRGGNEIAGTWPAGGAGNDVQRADGPAVWPLSPSRARARAAEGLAGPPGGALSPIQEALGGPPTYGAPRPPPLSQLGGGQIDAEPFAPGGGSSPPDDGRVEIFPHGGRGPRPTVIVPPSRLRALAQGRGEGNANEPQRPPQVALEQPAALLPAQGLGAGGNPEDRPAGSGTDVARTPPPDSTTASRGMNGSPASPPESRPASDTQTAQGPASDRPGTRASLSGSAAGVAHGSPAGSPIVEMSNHSGKPASELPMSPFSQEPNRTPERVLQLVIECTSKGVVIQPGGFRVSTQNLRAGDGYLVAQLQQIVQRRRSAEPDVFWLPRLRFLVEPGGGSTYWEARKQTALAGTGWPVSLQVAEADKLRLLEQERRE